MNLIKICALMLLMMEMACNLKPNNNKPRVNTVKNCSEVTDLTACLLSKTENAYCTVANKSCIAIPLSKPYEGSCEEITDISKCVRFDCKVDNKLCVNDKPGKCGNLTPGGEDACKPPMLLLPSVHGMWINVKT